MRKGLIAMFCMLALCFGIAAPAFADEASNVTIKETNIKADSVFNNDGYGSISTNYNYNSSDSAPRAAVIDRSGEFVIPFKETWNRFYYADGVFSLISDSPYMQLFLDDYYQNGDKPGFYTVDGSPIDAGDLWGASVMRDGYAFVTYRENSSTGPDDISRSACVIDRNGKVVLNLGESYATPLNGGDAGFFPYYLAMWNYDMVGTYSDGLFNCWGYASVDDYRNNNCTSLYYMDLNGNKALELPTSEYFRADPFRDELAAVQSRGTGKWGFINKSGKLVIPCEYDSVYAFEDGLCPMSKNGKWGYVDKKGNTVIPFEYDDAYGAGDGLAAVVKNGKCGLVDYENNVVVLLVYDDISSYDGGIAYAVKDGKVVLISGYEDTPRLTVTFNANGWGTAPAAATVAEGATVSEPAAPTAIGYTFGGWYTDAACTKAYDFSAPVTANLTLYAKWNRNQPANGGVEIYRLYNGSTGEHLLTSDANEANVQAGNGWKYENVAWTAPKSSDKPIYRLYNAATGEHLCTTDKNEYDTLTTMGWTGEGVKFYSADSDGLPTYRLHNPWDDGPRAHLYTTDANERNTLLGQGWEDEKICWYGLR